MSKSDAGWRVGLAAGVLLSLASGVEAGVAAPPPGDEDLTGLSLEQLMSLEVSSASRFPQKTVEAPASVTIITAADIRSFGYRTLDDLLRSVRGMHLSYDRAYSYLGVRGFGRTGDYNSRILLLLDGQRLNDPIYDTAPIGAEFPVDVDLIDRVEIVRGPGSSVYGSNAVFGIVNVITKRGRDMKGVEASADVGSFGTDEERGTWGGQSEGGFEWLLSGTRAHSEGQDLYYPEFDSPATNNGVADGVDGDRHWGAFGKLAWRGFVLTAMHSERTKYVPTASFGTVFNDPHARTSDDYTLFNLAYDTSFGARWNASANLNYGDYPYHGVYPYGPPPVVLNLDAARSQWWGAQAQAIGAFDRHKLLVGAEYQDNYHLVQINHDQDPFTLYTDDRRRTNRKGVYVQDEFTIRDGLLLNAGLRYDRYSNVGDSLNPRLGLIWSPFASTALKLIYGTAFRAPNTYELYYSSGGIQKANPGLKPEEITTWEFIVEHYLRPDFRITLDGYYNRINDLIDQVTDPADGLSVFENVGDATARGVEVEAERVWAGGARLRVSYAWQLAEDRTTGAVVVNSPKHLAELNFSVPIGNSPLRAGMETQYTSSRRTLAGDSAHAYPIVNLTLLGEDLLPGVTIATSFYNLFDEHYSDPGGLEHTQDLIPQDGRSFRLKLEYRF